MKTTINMFLYQKADEPARGGIRASFVPVLVCLILAASVFGLYAFASMQGKALDTKIAQAEQMVYDPVFTEDLQSMNKTQTLLDQYALYTSAVDSVYQTLSDTVEFDSEIYNTISAAKPARVTFTGLSFAQRTLTIACSTQDNLPPADFAQALDALGTFEAVEYKGFTGEPETGYTFMIACVLPQGGTVQ